MLSVEAERLAQELAAQNGKSVDDVVIIALREQAEREKRRAHIHNVMKEIQDRVAELPVLDDRSADEILAYNEWGLPHWSLAKMKSWCC
jgi:antitoxin VapB